MNGTEKLRPEMDRIQRQALAIGLAVGAVCVAGAFFNYDQFLHSYLMAYLFWIGIALGCTAIAMVHHLTGGGWGFIIRRLLESGSRTIFLMALLILPLLFSLPRLYEWARPGAAAGDEILQHKSLYLNVPFFLGRTAAYFLIWVLLAWFLNRWSSEQDATGGSAPARKLRSLSGPGILLYGITVTFASIDWAMSLEPHNYSTIYGMLFMVGQGLTAMAFVVAIAILLANRGALAEAYTTTRLHDLGNLMLAFVMLWAYIAFSQFLIVWSGNLPEEITWYTSRLRHGWAVVAVLLIAFHFALPFLFLLSRDVKRRTRRLLLVAGALIVMRLVDIFWLIEPAYGSAGPQVHWMDLLVPVALGGFWVAMFVSHLKRRPLVPVNDPWLKERLSHG